MPRGTGGSTLRVLILRLQTWAGHSLLEPPLFLPAGWGCAQALTSPSLASQGLSFIIFVCYVASSASAFLTAPLLEFLLALCFLFADAMQLNDKWQGLCWPMMVRAGAPGGRGWLALTLPSSHWRLFAVSWNLLGRPGLR